jgi:monoamine oxidase
MINPGPSGDMFLSTRRQFLEQVGRKLGTGMVLTALNAFGISTASSREAPPELRGSGKGKKIAILGAGHAGQTAAYELSKLGYDCVIIEARGFAGGRCQSARQGTILQELGGETQKCTFDAGQYINIGPWRIPYHHRSTLHYTREFGVPLEIMVNDNDAAYLYAEKIGGPLSDRPIRKAEILADMHGHTNDLIAKAASGGKLDGLMTAEDRELFLAYLVNEGHLTKDQAYLGTPGRGYKVDPGAGIDPGAGVMSDPYNFTDLLKSKLWGSLQSVGSFDQQRTMFQPVGGMDQIAKAFQKRVGHMTRYHSEVEKVVQSESGVQVFYVDTKSGKRSTLIADYCICAIPLSVVRGLDINFSSAFKDAIGRVSYATVGKIGLQMKRRFWELDDQIYGGHITTNFKDIFQISLPSSGWQQEKGVILGAYLFQANAARISGMSLTDRLDVALAAGEKVFPGRYRANFESGFSWFWHRAQYNLGGWAEWSPEGRRDAYPKLLEPDGRIYLAGEHLSHLTGWQAGAFESAWQQIEKLHNRVSAA